MDFLGGKNIRYSFVARDVNDGNIMYISSSRKYKIGYNIRISKIKGLFEKCYTTNCSKKRDVKFYGLDWNINIKY